MRYASGIRDLLFLFTMVCFSACSRPGATGVPHIRLVSPGQAGASAYVEVTGLSDVQQNALARPGVPQDEWQRVLRVTVRQDDASKDSLPVAGRYAIDGDVLRFTPLFPFDPGREYEVRFGSIAATVSLPPRPAASPAYVTAVYPSGGVVPENQLRMYIHFSAPMGRRGGVDRVKLLDDRGREVEMPFLPLEAEFWNADRTRYTVFFDPGRQKRGIRPNREMGPSLVTGRTYTLVVDRSWIDGNGNPLRESFTKRFRVGPPVLSALRPERWRIEPPKAGTRDPLSVMFPDPLDHALLQDAIGVRYEGHNLTGEIRADAAETRWVLTPSERWRPGRYELTVLSILEDVAGNRVGRPFEVSEFSQPPEPRTDSIAATLPFTVQP